MRQGAKWATIILLVTAAVMLLPLTRFYPHKTVITGKVVRKLKNHLANEKSPYLKLHADNPVDWYPWGDEAFLKAKKEDKPIFLSIGYSACHYCLLMERESFTDNEIAAILNMNFISVKVDREERPDVDNIYMAYTVSVTGSGGWPMSIFMTPDKRPFFLGTYFPKKSFKGLLIEISRRYREDRPGLFGYTNKIAELMKRDKVIESEPDNEIELKAYERFMELFDTVNGGFGFSAKFPTPVYLTFLMGYYDRFKERSALNMVDKSLTAMQNGGIYDSIGGGFHRYTTDSKWKRPHFEKMLYDQALVSMAYTDAYLLTGKYQDTLNETLDYLLRDMSDANGCFYTSEGAETDGIEGGYYLWPPAELRGLGISEQFIRRYNISDANSIPYITEPIETVARDTGLAINDLTKIINRDRMQLFKARSKRSRPFRDEKILTDYNGLAIAALSTASRALGSTEYANAAARCADFILTDMIKDGRLMHSLSEKTVMVDGFLDDYAYLAYGLIELYQATFRTEYLLRAIKLTDEAFHLFADARDGRIYFSASTKNRAIESATTPYDSDRPAGQSVMVHNLFRLGLITKNMVFIEIGTRYVKAMGEEINRSPVNFSFMLQALRYKDPSAMEIVIAGKRDAVDTNELLKVVNGRYLSASMLLFRPNGTDEINKLNPAIPNMKPVDKKAAAYICVNGSCQSPVTNPNELALALNRRWFEK